MKYKGFFIRLIIGIILLIFSPILWFLFNLSYGAFFVFPITFLLAYPFCSKEEKEELKYPIRFFCIGVFDIIFQYIIYGKLKGYYKGIFDFK